MTLYTLCLKGKPLGFESAYIIKTIVLLINSYCYLLIATQFELKNLA